MAFPIPRESTGLAAQLRDPAAPLFVAAPGQLVPAAILIELKATHFRAVD